MKIIIKNLTLYLPATQEELINLIHDQAKTLGKIQMKIEEVKAQLDETNAILENAVGVLNKVQAEVTGVSAVQAQTIADLQAQLEAVDTVPADVQASIDTLNGTVSQLNTIAANLDALNPDAPAPEVLVTVEGTDTPVVDEPAV